MATATHELLVATEASGQQYGAVAWDLHTGSTVRTFKGQAVAAGCLCLRSGHCLVGASGTKPLLQLWSLGKKDEAQQKIVCPGLFSTLAISFDGLFCVAGIGEKLYIWEMTAGNLLGLISDSDEIKKIQFTDDGSQLVVGTLSGMLKVWNFACVLSAMEQRARVPKPWRTISAHGEAITDIHVGCGGPAARVATASRDGTCKVWDLVSGELIRTVVFESRVESVLMDRQELYLIAGLHSGHILWCPMYEQLSKAETFVSKDATRAGEMVFQGDSGSPIGCLALSSDCQYLASGAEDGEVKVWRLSDGKNTTSIKLSAAVQNVMIIPPITQNSSLHHGPPVTFKQQMPGQENGRGRVFNFLLSDTSELPVPDASADIAKVLRLSSPLEEPEEENGEEPMDTTEKIQSLEREIARLKKLVKSQENNT